ncbi:PAS domain S-box protein [Persicimonas caeni]|uniref:histidine kinase n=1 Tax=Persicimonas caeni TaxID=2292766 RepID=A0A4Y6PZ55_PERCE|nr:ATP-binding protein [Persicimonas caeni]QDG53598.1 PAS domain S-box protein [Persicimonas caeni]QED34819.1 PAS domain S-box protein [Persicimonas caeni]
MSANYPREVIIRAVESVSDCVEITDAQGRIEYVNRAFEEKTGWSFDEVKGKTPAEVLRSGEHSDEYYDQIWEHIQTGEPWIGRMISEAKDGRRLIQEMLITPIKDDDGEITHFIAVKRDVTKRIQLETQLLEADRLAAVGRLAAGVGHEINNPLSYVLANIEYLKRMIGKLEDSVEQATLAEMSEVLDEAAQGATQIRDVVRLLSKMARPQDSSGQVDLEKVLNFALQLVGHELKHRVELDVECDELAPVIGNKSRLTQVFVNLLINAVQSIEVGHRSEHKISVRGYMDDGEVVVQVSDNGRGIPDAIVQRIFEPFFTTKEVGQGTGMGLSICYGIVTDLGGTISVDSEEGVGTTFEVRLPPAQLPSDATSTLSDKESSVADSALHVLFVDDDALIRRVAERFLTKHHALVMASSGAEALELLQGVDFDVVVCDLMMPEMDGRELYARCVELDLPCQDRFVFITGGAFTEEAARFAETVDASTVLKPFSRRDLLDAISEVAEGAAGNVTPA